MLLLAYILLGKSELPHCYYLIRPNYETDIVIAYWGKSWE